MSNHNQDPERLRQLLGELALDAEKEEEAPSGPLPPLGRQREDELVAMAVAHVKVRRQEAARLKRPEAPVMATPPAPVIPLQEARRKRPPIRLVRVVAYSSLVAAAAILAIVFIPPGGIGPEPESHQTYIAKRPPNPGQWSPDRQLLLGSSSTGSSMVQELTLHRNERLALQLWPHSPVKGPKVAHAFIRYPGQPPHRWQIEPEAQTDGSFLIDLALSDLKDLRNEQDILFVMTPPGTVPSPEAVAATSSSAAYSVLTIHLTILDEGTP